MPLALARQTARLVDTERCTTARARPLGLFTTDKTAQTIHLNALQIFDHAHAVLRAVSLVDVTESFARKLRTARAKLPVSSLLAISDFAGNAPLVALVGSATGTPIPAAQKRVTQSAIHPARRDQRRRSQASSGRFFWHSSTSKYAPLPA
jgi:hypothetical protein